jgi:peptide/nickel transport system substrate-binding protein
MPRRLASSLERRPSITTRALVAVMATAAVAGVFAACGRSSTTQAKKGGTLTVFATGDFQNLDPGASYNQFDYMLEFVTQRALYAWPPTSTSHPKPDLAASAPIVSDAGRTVTVRLKRGIRFSPPVNREVRSEDVKYAIERAGTRNVANGYFAVYFADLVGATEWTHGKSAGIRGIETPDPYTLVFRLRRPTAATFAQALSLPISAPVPKEYARRYDRHNPSTYAQHLVSTGPYRVRSYQAGRQAILDRNPNWDPATDWRPAYADRIRFSLGNDAMVAGRQILKGKGMLSGDFSAPAPIAAHVGERRRQIGIAPGVGVLFASLNTTIPPLNDVNVRRAIVAATDRDALRLTRGGASAGDLATHYLFPGMPGFEQAGGTAGPGYDFLRHPSGNLRVAREYLRKAGYPTGRYTGRARLLMVGSIESRVADVMEERLAALGFKMTVRKVPVDSMYTKFCAVPKAKVAICADLGWLKDFYDPQTVLDPMFDGHKILPVGNSNYSELDDPAVNHAIASAEPLISPRARARAWGNIDRMITADAAAIPWLWLRQSNLRSADVRGVVNRFTGSWDLAFTSLKQPH